jgi:prophage tail gpP-like protein
MPKLEEYCEVRTSAGVVRTWIRVLIQQSMDDEKWMRKFHLETSQPTRKRPAILPLERVDIALAGRVFIQEGYVKDWQVAFDSTKHAIQAEGFSKAGTLARVSVDIPGGQLRNYSVDALANAALKPYGLKFRVEGGPAGWNTPFPNVAVRHGESPFAFIRRLCRQRGLWMRTEPNGDVVAGKKDGGGAVLEEGRNIAIGRCQITTPEAEEFVLRSQHAGSDSLFGKPVSEVSAKGKIEGGIKGKQIIVNEMPASQKELQLRADMQAQMFEASFLRVSVTHKGWLKPGSDELWTLTEQVKVKSPMLFPIGNGEMSLRVWSITNTQDGSGATSTSLELVNERTFSIKSPDANQRDPFFMPKASPSQPETPA